MLVVFSSVYIYTFIRLTLNPSLKLKQVGGLSCDRRVFSSPSTVSVYLASSFLFSYIMGQLLDLGYSVVMLRSQPPYNTLFLSSRRTTRSTPYSDYFQELMELPLVRSKHQRVYRPFHLTLRLISHLTSVTSGFVPIQPPIRGLWIILIMGINIVMWPPTPVTLKLAAA